VDGVHHALEGRIEEPLGGFRVEVANQLRRAFEVGKQDRHLLPFAFKGAAGGEDFLHQIGWGVGQWGPRSLRDWGASRPHRRGCRTPAPDQHRPLLIGRETLTVDEFNLEILDRFVIELELPLERAIGHAAPLAQEGEYLIHDRDKVHRVSSRSVVVPVCA
jgi:hypothetical protein